MKAIDDKLGSSAGISYIDVWQLNDGTQRGRVRLPLVKAQSLYGQKLLISYCISTVREAEKRPLERQRCFRCLTFGHLARDCSSDSDRKDLCIQCGEAGHQARSCTASVRCILCGGPHRIGYPSCGTTPAQCRV